MGVVADSVATWWEPQGQALSIAIALLSTICWGSWSNTAKAAGDKVNFAHFYTDFCLGTVVAAIVFWVSLGAHVPGGEEVELHRIFWACAAGFIFGVANLLLTTGIALAGLSIAFPLCIGTGLVLGTILTYFVDTRGQPLLIFPGVFFALLGVLANARAYGLLHTSRQSKQSTSSSDVDESGCETSDSAKTDSKQAIGGGSARDGPARSSFKRDVSLCIVGGVLMGLWAPLNVKAMEGEAGLSPYFSFAWFTAASMTAGVLIISGQQCGMSLMPRVGPVTSARNYFSLPLVMHGWGLLGGSVWALGTVSSLVSGKKLGYALAYALGQTAPVVAVLWGLLWYREFDGAPREAVAWLLAMFFCFLIAITMLCLGGH